MFLPGVLSVCGVSAHVPVPVPVFESKVVVESILTAEEVKVKGAEGVNNLELDSAVITLSEEAPAPLRCREWMKEEDEEKVTLISNVAWIIFLRENNCISCNVAVCNTGWRWVVKCLVLILACEFTGCPVEHFGFGFVLQRKMIFWIFFFQNFQRSLFREGGG